MRKILTIILFLIAVPVFHAWAQETETRYLSGTGSDDVIKWDFLCTGGMNANKWTTIPVPSCWELQGFGKYDYGFAKDSLRGKEQGMYKYRFFVPTSWKDKVINIVFEGVMTDAIVKVNGQQAGEIHQGAFYAFKYEITKLLKYGASNLLEVTVSKHSDNASVNEAERKADFWLFGGIFRPVWLEALPKVNIQHIAIDAKADGSFAANIETEGSPERASVQVYSPGNEKLGNPVVMKFNTSANSIRLEYKFNSPKLWNPEMPNLYKATITLYKNGKALHTITKKFGFRTVEVRQRDGIYINGVKVKMKGVNRSPFRPETGRTLSIKESIEDVLLIKSMNMNAIRCSHYPPEKAFLDACDSLGLFVMDELAGWHGNYDTETGKKLLKEMIDHDVNHPSIVLWANGNEGGHNLELDKYFTEFDIQKSPVVHPWQLFNGIETQHYREYNYGIGNYEQGNEIVMPTEFLHGQFDGGHGAGLEDYWEKMWNNPLSAGGFLWDLADQGVVRKDLHDSLDTDKFRAADGIVGPHHEKEGSYFAIKEIWSPVHFERREITPEFDGKLNIENRYLYTNLDKCRFSYSLKKFDQGADFKKTIAAPSVQPRSTGLLQLDLPKNWKDYDALYVTVHDAYGREMITKSFAIILPRQLLPDTVTANTVAARLLETDSMFIVTANNVQISIHKRTGLLTEVRSENDVIPITNGPVIEEGANNFGRFSAKEDSGRVYINAAFDKKEHYNTLSWTIYPNGIVRMQVDYFPAAYFTSLVGVNFSYPESRIRSVDYIGDGPYRVWKNRVKGTQFGNWHKPYNNTETGESPWIYPEFKGYYSDFYKGNFIGDDHSFKVYTPTENLFLRLFTPAWKTDQWHNYEPIFPGGDISFMQGISSIGSKTQRNTTTGPMGEKNIFYDYEKDPARALHLVLYFDFRKQTP